MVQDQSLGDDGLGFDTQFTPGGNYVLVLGDKDLSISLGELGDGLDVVICTQKWVDYWPGVNGDIHEYIYNSQINHMFVPIKRCKLTW